MLWFFLVFAAFVFITQLLTRLYGNPFQLIFIFGKKGAGKSCLMVHHMKRYLRRGWAVYTDMQDCKLPGVRLINASDLQVFVPVCNSFLCLDEVGITFDNRKFKSFSDGYRDFFKFQRKYKVRVLMNSQSFDIDLKVRSLVDRMILQTNWMNCISISRPILRSITLTEPQGDKDSRIADRLKFGPIWTWRFYWMPKYFKYFDSFSAPLREEIPYRQIPASRQLSLIQRFFNRRSRD